MGIGEHHLFQGTELFSDISWVMLVCVYLASSRLDFEVVASRYGHRQ